MTSILKVDEIQNTDGKTGIVITPDGSLESVKFPEQSSPSGRVITSTTMSSFEEGTWTPTLHASGGGFAGTFTVHGAYYTKIGSTVWVNCFISAQVTAIGSGHAEIRGLPFEVTGASVPFKANYGNLVLSNGGYFEASNKTMRFIQDHLTTPMPFAGIGSRAIMVSGHYRTDE